MSKNIDVTVFIPTWFGEDYIDNTLKSVFKQETPFNYEVLIYDTSSTDRTPQIIQKYADKHDNLRYKTLKKEEYGHGKTRQAAAHDAKGDIIVYLSQDAQPAHKGWLYEMVKPFSLNEKIVAVMGKQDPRPKCVPILKYEIKAVFNNFGPDFGTTLFYNDNFIKEQAIYDAVSFYSDVNSAARKDFLLNKIGYKDVPYSEDQLFGREVIEAGYFKAFAARGNVLHSNDMKLNEYKNRMFDETTGLRKVGIDVAAPSRKRIIKMVLMGVMKDSVKTLRDPEYSLKRKIFWFFVNPLYHIEKWRGVRLGATANLNDSESHNKYSLEKLRNRQ